MDDLDQTAVRAYYARGEERDRLRIDARGVLEFERTAEIIARQLPTAPAVIADVGGGPGRYALWLTEQGYQVEHRDLMALHIEQVRQEAGHPLRLRTKVADARSLDLTDASVDAVLLLGPIYHLPSRADRIQALREAARIVRPGGPVFAAAISRWAPRLDGVLRTRMYQDQEFAGISAIITHQERTGRMPPLHPGAFTAYCHRPGQLRHELRAAGLEVADLVAVEGAGYLLGDLEERRANRRDWEVVLDTARATERVPELLGIGPHLLATALRPGLID